MIKKLLLFLIPLFFIDNVSAAYFIGSEHVGQCDFGYLEYKEIELPCSTLDSLKVRISNYMITRDYDSYVAYFTRMTLGGSTKVTDKENYPALLVCFGNSEEFNFKGWNTYNYGLELKRCIGIILTNDWKDIRYYTSWLYFRDGTSPNSNEIITLHTGDDNYPIYTNIDGLYSSNFCIPDSTGASTPFDVSSLVPYFFLCAFSTILVFIAVMWKRRC